MHKIIVAHGGCVIYILGGSRTEILTSRRRCIGHGMSHMSTVSRRPQPLQLMSTSRDAPSGPSCRVPSSSCFHVCCPCAQRRCALRRCHCLVKRGHDNLPTPSSTAEITTTATPATTPATSTRTTLLRAAETWVVPQIERLAGSSTERGRATRLRSGGSNGADQTAVDASASTSSALRPRRDKYDAVYEPDRASELAEAVEIPDEGHVGVSGLRVILMQSSGFGQQRCADPH